MLFDSGDVPEQVRSLLLRQPPRGNQPAGSRHLGRETRGKGALEWEQSTGWVKREGTAWEKAREMNRDVVR